MMAQPKDDTAMPIIATQLREWAARSGPTWYGVPIVLAAADEIARLTAEVERLRSPAWIPVTERTPPRNEIVWVIDQCGVNVGSYSPMLDDWWTLHVDRMAPGATVSHWMPRPSPPATREEE